MDEKIRNSCKIINRICHFPQFLLSSICAFLQSIHINIGLNLAPALLCHAGQGFASTHCSCKSRGDWKGGKVERGWDLKVRSWEEIGRVKLRRAMLCVRGEECQYLAVKYRVEEIMFLPHEAFHYFKLPLQSLLKDPSSSSPDKSFNKGRGWMI